MWQKKTGLAPGEGSAARRASASGFVLSGTALRSPKPAGG